jgi:hypothetical protein
MMSSRTACRALLTADGPLGARRSASGPASACRRHPLLPTLLPLPTCPPRLQAALCPWRRSWCTSTTCCLWRRRATPAPRSARWAPPAAPPPPSWASAPTCPPHWRRQATPSGALAPASSWQGAGGGRRCAADRPCLLFFALGWHHARPRVLGPGLQGRAGGGTAVHLEQPRARPGRRPRGHLLCPGWRHCAGADVDAAEAAAHERWAAARAFATPG